MLAGLAEAAEGLDLLLVAGGAGVGEGGRAKGTAGREGSAEAGVEGSGVVRVEVGGGTAVPCGGERGAGDGRRTGRAGRHGGRGIEDGSPARLGLPLGEGLRIEQGLLNVPVLGAHAGWVFGRQFERLRVSGAVDREEYEAGEDESQGGPAEVGIAPVECFEWVLAGHGGRSAGVVRE